MATAASLKFSIESTWDGSGVRRARDDLNELQRQVRAIGDRVTVRVKVEPSMVGFASKVRDGARGITVEVRVDPNLTGFQTRLNNAVRSRDFRIEVRIDPSFSSSAVSDLRSRLNAQDFNVPVRLEPDATGFQAQLNALSAMHDFHINVRINVDASSLAQLQALLRRLGGSSNNAQGSLTGLIGTLAGLFTIANLAKLAVAALAFDALTPLIAAALQATTVLLGIPAAIAGVGLVAGTVAIGLDGMSEAFKGLAISGGDFAMSAGDFQALLDKELMPAAHDFMWALRDLRWEWELLTATVQTNLFQGLGQQMRELGDIYMPKLKDGFAGLSVELNKGILRFMEKLKDPQYGAAIDTLFANVTKAVGPATDAVGDFVLALINIASAGSGALPTIAEDLAKCAKAFKEWTENPENAAKIKDWILEGWESLKDIAATVWEFATVTLPKIAAWVSEHKDDFKSWKDGIEDFVNAAGKVLDVLGEIVSLVSSPLGLAGWLLLPDMETAVGIVNDLKGALNTLKIAFLDVAIGVAQMGANLLNTLASVFDVIPGMGGVADKMRAVADTIEGGVIPALQKTKDELVALQVAAAATEAVNAAMKSLADGTRITTTEVTGLQMAMDAESRAMLNAGASVADVTARREELVTAFQESARAAGMAELDIQKFSDQLRQIPKDIQAKVTATLDTQQFLFSFNDVYTLMNQLDAASVTPEVRAEVQQALSDFKLTADELANLDLTTASPEVIAIITEALTNLATVNNGLDETGAKKPTPEVGIVDNATGPLGAIQGEMGKITDKTVTITVNTVYTGASASGSVNAAKWRGGIAGRWRGGIAGGLTGRWNGGTAPKLPGYTGGYRLPTSGPGTDIRDGFLALTSKGKPIANVDAGEWIINGRSSEKFNSALSALNRNNPMAAIASLQRYVGTDRPSSRRQSTPSVSAATGGAGGSSEVHVYFHHDGNANEQTFRAASKELVPAVVMAIKQGVGVRAKVAN